MVKSMTDLLEEISQQPAVLSGLRKFYASPGAIPARGLRSLAPHWPPTVVFTGMGSSLFAAYPAQAYLTEQGVRALVWETAELVHHHLKVLRPDTLLVVVSQSGQTAEVLRLLESLPAKARVLAVTNVEASPLAKRAKLLLPLMAGGQVAVSTKTYTCSVAVLMYLAFAIAGKAPSPLTQEVMRAVEAQEKILERREVLMPPIEEFFNRPSYVALMSRGADLASAHQGAMMLKQVARLAAEPMSAAQFRHGPMEIINPNHRYILFARQGKTGKLLLKLASDIRKSSGRVLLFTDMPFDDLMNMRLVGVEPLRLGLGTLVDSVYIQLLAYDAALRAGLQPGKIEIAENVTREE
jgi:glucosamine--fructose-6-phosphate aminotransferase (isomerizing)